MINETRIITQLKDDSQKEAAFNTLVHEYQEVNLKVVQPERYQLLMKNRLAEGKSLTLDPDFVRHIIQTIHEESVRQQLD